MTHYDKADEFLEALERLGKGEKHYLPLASETAYRMRQNFDKRDITWMSPKQYNYLKGRMIKAEAHNVSKADHATICHALRIILDNCHKLAIEDADLSRLVNIDHNQQEGRGITYGEGQFIRDQFLTFFSEEESICSKLNLLKLEDINEHQSEM